MKRYFILAAIIPMFLLANCTRIISHVIGTPARGNEFMTLERNVMVPMRDGIKLATDIYRPKGPGKYPAILCRLPYGSDNQMFEILGKLFTSQGYIFVVQDTRGAYASEGTYFPLMPEMDDGRDTVDWITRQPWFNGKLGTWGGSYFGYTQWEAAVDNRAISAMSPIETSGTIKDIIFRGGAVEYASFVPWNAQMTNAWNKKQGINQVLVPDILSDGYFNMVIRDAKPINPQNLFQNPELLDKGMDFLLRHPGDIENIYQLDFSGFYGRVSAPSLMLAGWYDVFTGPQLEDFRHIRGEGMGDARLSRIIVGPWTHGAPGIPNNKIFQQSMLSGISLFGKDMMAWYDHWLKGADNGAEKKAPMKIFVMGENTWRDENEWPLSRTKFTGFYIHGAGKANSIKGDGSLDLNAPGDETSDRFNYDPANPVPTRGGSFLPSKQCPAGAFDQAQIEQRSDVLVYASAPLKERVEVTGPVKMILYAQSDAKDTDFTAKLVDIWPDGKSINLCDGIIRARYREGYAKPSAITPGKVYKYEIDMWATSNVFLPGHRIGLEISSSNFPHFDRNTNCAGEGWGECRKIAHQTIIHNAENPSRLILPIIP